MARKLSVVHKWKDEWSEILIHHMEKGYSFESFGAVANVNRQCLYQWVDKYPNFAQAKSLGDCKSRKFWEGLGIAGTCGKINGFSSSTWIFTMKCRFGYRDGSETGEQTDTKKDLIYKTKWGNSKKKSK